MIKIKSMEQMPGNRTKLVIEVLQTNEDTTLTQDLEMVVYGSNYVEPLVESKFVFDELKTTNTREALQKMSEWCYRMGESLEEASKAPMMELPL